MRTGAIGLALLAIGVSAVAEDVIQMKPTSSGRAGERIVCSVVQVTPDRVLYCGTEGAGTNVVLMSKVVNILFDVLVPEGGQPLPEVAQGAAPAAAPVVVMPTGDAEKIISASKTLKGTVTSVLNMVEAPNINDGNLDTCYYFKGGTGAVDIKVKGSVTARGLVLIGRNPWAPGQPPMNEGRVIVNGTITNMIPLFPAGATCVVTLPKVLIKSVRVESLKGTDPGIKEIKYFN